MLHQLSVYSTPNKNHIDQKYCILIKQYNISNKKHMSKKVLIIIIEITNLRLDLEEKTVDCGIIT